MSIVVLFSGRISSRRGSGSAPAIVSRDFAELVATAHKRGWTGYFGAPAIATPEAGRRAMDAIAQAAVDLVLKVLDGGGDQGPRVADRPASDTAFKRVVEAALEHERQDRTETGRMACEAAIREPFVWSTLRGCA